MKASHRPATWLSPSGRRGLEVAVCLVGLLGRAEPAAGQAVPRPQAIRAAVTPPHAAGAVSSAPHPADQSLNQSTNLTLQWTAACSAGSTQSVNFGSVAFPPTIVSNLPPTQGTYAPNTLRAGLTYFWQIGCTDASGTTTLGPTWSFTTQGLNSSVFSSGGVTLPYVGGAEVSGSSELYSLKVFGGAKQDGHGGYTSNVIFSASLESNVVNAVKDPVVALREYLLSTKGSPVSLAFTSSKMSWSSYQPTNVQQSWLDFQPYVTARIVPVNGSTASYGAAVTAGFTVQFNIEIEAEESGANGTTVFPGTIVLSVSPSLVGPIGSNLQAAVFAGTTSSTVTYGVDYKVMFSLRGDKPVSVGLVGTGGPKGFVTSQNSIGVEINKILGF